MEYGKLQQMLVGSLTVPKKTMPTRSFSLLIILFCNVVLQTCEGNVKLNVVRAPDKVPIFISIMPISSSNPMFDHLFESSWWDDSNKWSNIGFGKEITQVSSQLKFILGSLSGALCSTRRPLDKNTSYMNVFVCISQTNK